MIKRMTVSEQALAAIRMAGTLQEHIRQQGFVDLSAMTGKPILQGALAELEMQGAIEFTGPPGADWKIPCRVVPESVRSLVRAKNAASEVREWDTMPLPSRRRSLPST